MFSNFCKPGLALYKSRESSLDSHATHVMIHEPMRHDFQVAYITFKCSLLYFYSREEEGKGVLSIESWLKLNLYSEKCIQIP